MPLEANTIYAIRNDLTHTFLDFTGNTTRNAFVMGWGWHGGNNQKWKLIQVGAPDLSTWKLQNQRNNPGRFLCPQLEDAQPNDHYRLAGGIVACDFVIEQVGETEGYRILFNNLAVTLVTGQEVYKIQDRDRVADVYADSSPIALQHVEQTNRAQIWSFLAADLPVIPALQDDRAYKIINSQTGTVLDVANTVGKPVEGIVSKGEGHHEWTIIGGAPNSDHYKFKSSTIANHFLAPDNNLPGNGTPLIGGLEAQAKHFTIRNVPGTRLYKIFYDPLSSTISVGGLAVNLNVVDGAPDSLDGAVVSLQAAEAQQWYFIEVMP